MSIDTVRAMRGLKFRRDSLANGLASVLIFSLVGFMPAWWWLSMVGLKGPALEFALVQTGLVALAVYVADSVRVGVMVRIMCILAAGLLASFVSSVLHEALHDPRFLDSIQQHRGLGRSVEQMAGWLVASVAYGGALQALLLAWCVGLFKKRT